jgi:hypothetical protein
MPRNTQALVIFLAVFAGTVAAVNVSRMPQPARPSKTDNQEFIPLTSPNPTAIRQTVSAYSDPGCRISFDYPGKIRLYNDPAGGTIIIDPDKPDSIIMVRCSVQKPPISFPKSGDTAIGSISAQLFSEATEAASNTAELNKALLFPHPKTKLWIQLSAPAKTLDRIFASLKIF